VAIQADAVPLEQTAAAPELAVVVALGVERACLESAAIRNGIEILVVQSGPGPMRAAEAAHSAITGGARALVSFGLAGGLAPGLAPGAVVLPERIITEAAEAWRVDAAWHGALIELLSPEFELADGVLLSTARVLVDPKDKAALFRAHGAVACDMESAAICAAATEAGVPSLALRVVADTVEDRLPTDVAGWVDAAGESRVGPLLAAMSRPDQWRPTFVLASRFAKARRTLMRLAALLAPLGFARQPLRSR
jgi:adenosylhomocysteine nucleosidase